MNEVRKAQAERYLRGVYGGDPSAVDDLASEDIVSSYPIFESLFGEASIRGRAAVREFAAGFGKRWSDAQITIYEAIAEGDRVVLVWGFRARNTGAGPSGKMPSNQEHSWGGISLIRFNAAGKIAAEIGEESAPGPFERLAAGNDVRPPS